MVDLIGISWDQWGDKSRRHSFYGRRYFSQLRHSLLVAPPPKLNFAHAILPATQANTSFGFSSMLLLAMDIFWNVNPEETTSENDHKPLFACFKNNLLTKCLSKSQDDTTNQFKKKPERCMKCKFARQKKTVIQCRQQVGANSVVLYYVKCCASLSITMRMLQNSISFYNWLLLIYWLCKTCIYTTETK